MPKSHTLTATVSMAWTINRPLGLRRTMCSGTTHRLLLLRLHQFSELKSAIVTWQLTPLHRALTPCKAIIQPKPYTSCQLTVMHYQRTDVGYSFIADFCHQLIRESLIFARFSAAGMGVGLYTRDGLYTSTYGISYSLNVNEIYSTMKQWHRLHTAS